MDHDIDAQIKEAAGRAKTSELIPYAVGIFCCSVCAPADWSAERVEAETNRVLVCGTSSGWTVSTDEQFASGQPMPCACDKDAARKHWLLDA